MRRRILILAAVAAMMLLPAGPATALEGETFAITEVDFEAGTITVTNYGDADVDPNGLLVCNFPAYAPITDAPILGPGESMVVDLAAISIPADAADGELGLYLNNDWANSDSIVAYVEWGTTGHERSPVAQGAQVGGVAVWDGDAVAADAAALQTQVPFPTAGSQWTAVAAQADELPFTGLSTAQLVVGALALMTLGVAVVRRTSQAT